MLACWMGLRRRQDRAAREMMGLDSFAMFVYIVVSAVMCHVLFMASGCFEAGSVSSFEGERRPANGWRFGSRAKVARHMDI